MISVDQDKSGVEPLLIFPFSAVFHVSLFSYFAMRQMRMSTLPGLQQLGCSTIFLWGPHSMLEHNPAAKHACWIQKDKESAQENCHLLWLLDCLCALLSIVILKGPHDNCFCVKTMLGAHVKRTSWLNRHYEAQWSATCFQATPTVKLSNGCSPVRQKRMAFSCILFSSKVQYYTVLMFYCGFQWENSTTINPKK